MNRQPSFLAYFYKNSGHLRTSAVQEMGYYKFKVFKILSLITFMLVSPVYSLSGQNKKPQEYRFAPLKSIPTQRAVATFSQDQQGFIWMGTNGLGLNKFNGLDFVSYQFKAEDSTSLSSSLVHTTYIDKNNRLWIGTETGLDLYNRNHDNFFHIDFSKKNKKETIGVHAILEKKDGDILVGTHQFGLYSLDALSLNVTQVRISGITEVRNFLINTISYFDNRILLGTDKGVFEYDEELNTAAPLEFITSSGKERIEEHIQTALLDAKGSIWLGTTTKGVYKIDTNENGRYELEHFPITSRRILSLLETPRNTVLCGTENDGMFEIDRQGRKINHYLNNKYSDNGIKSNSIWSLFLDNHERIWIGYYNNGIGVYDKSYDKFADIESKVNNPNSLQAGSVTGILKDSLGRLWIGMDGGGIDVFDPNINEFTHLLNNKNKIANGLDSPDVQTLFMDSKGNIWVGTWDYGIYFLKKGSDSFINYSVENTGGAIASNRILSFSEDSKGTIWIGTFSRGVHSYDPGSKKFRIYDAEPFLSERISYSDVRRVYVDSRDQVWIGANSGLFRLKPSNNRYDLEVLSPRFYENAGEQLYHSQILDIYEDSSHRIWIGTDGSGICAYNMKDDSFSWIKPENGLNKVTVSSIIQDDQGALWIAGNNGIAKMSGKKKILKNYSIEDGLLSNDFNNNAAYKDKSGTLYFGSYDGVNYFNPDNLIVDENPSTVYFTDFKIFNESMVPGRENSPLDKVISQTDKIILSHSQSVFTIDFASIDFTRPKTIQFAYYLEGFEDDWNYVQNTRSATYTNLPAGNYTFKVKATNHDGTWDNIQPTTLSIRILKPWWITNFAILGYIILLTLLGYIIFRFLNSRLKSKRIIAQERERHLQEEALNDKKIQFFTNISHEFRTPLTLISSPLQDILEEENLSESVREKLKIINKNTTRLKRLIDELMDFKKLQSQEIPLQIATFNIAELIEENLEYFREEAAQRHIKLSAQVDYNLGNIVADKNKLEKVIFNILSNAFKSTPNKGKITVVAAKKEKHIFKSMDSYSPFQALDLSIIDTGKGIPPDELNKIFDRFYQIKDQNEQYYSGTGIGLEVVRSFVKLHRGDIHVESEPGVGTKFRIYLPMEQDFYSKKLAMPEQKEVHGEEEKVQLSLENYNDGVKKTILIVEDNLELRNYLKEELSPEYKVLVAEDGEEGLEKAKKYMPAIVITDVLMPKMSGIELCSLLKEDLKTSHIPVLMLTAKTMTDDWVKGFEAGADLYLNKPFEMKIMRSQIKQLISNRARLFTKYVGTFNKTVVEPSSTSLDQQFILEIIRYTRENIKEPNLNVEKLSVEFNLSRSQLYRKIKALTDLTANELIRKIRLERAKELLEENSSLSVSEISYNVGFSSPSYFSKCFKAHFGVLPREIKEE